VRHSFVSCWRRHVLWSICRYGNRLTSFLRGGIRHLLTGFPVRTERKFSGALTPRILFPHLFFLRYWPRRDSLPDRFFSSTADLGVFQTGFRKRLSHRKDFPPLNLIDALPRPVASCLRLRSCDLSQMRFLFTSRRVPRSCLFVFSLFNFSKAPSPPNRLVSFCRLAALSDLMSAFFFLD